MPGFELIVERKLMHPIQPKSSCIDEWDALHAMWLYEMMELHDVEDDTMNNWKPGSSTKGLNLPILLKVIFVSCDFYVRETDYVTR